MDHVSENVYNTLLHCAELPWLWYHWLHMLTCTARDVSLIKVPPPSCSKQLHPLMIRDGLRVLPDLNTTRMPSLYLTHSIFSLSPFTHGRNKVVVCSVVGEGLHRLLLLEESPVYHLIWKTIKVFPQVVDLLPFGGSNTDDVSPVPPASNYPPKEPQMVMWIEIIVSISMSRFLIYHCCCHGTLFFNQGIQEWQVSICLFLHFEVNNWILLVEMCMKVPESFPAIWLHDKCVIYISISHPPLWLQSKGVKISFLNSLKPSIDRLAMTGDKGNPIATPSNCSYKSHWTERKLSWPNSASAQLSLIMELLA